MRFALTLVIVLGISILGACSDEDVLAPNMTEDGVVTTTTLEFYNEWTVFADCVFDGRGEMVHGAATVRLDVHRVTTPAGVVVTSYAGTYLSDVTMTGLESGHTYSLARPYRSMQLVVSNEGYRTIHYIDNLRIVDDVSGTIYDWPARLHATWNEGGLITSYFEVYPCKSIPADG